MKKESYEENFSRCSFHRQSCTRQTALSGKKLTIVNEYQVFARHMYKAAIGTPCYYHAIDPTLDRFLR